MRIVNLMENTKGREGCVFAHGLSFYVETAKHRLLLDLGPSEETLTNAERMGVDLSLVDTVILSHGHYDHSGGILAFAEKNAKAVIYMQTSAAGEYFADDGVAAVENGFSKENAAKNCIAKDRGFVPDKESFAEGNGERDVRVLQGTGVCRQYRYIGIDQRIKELAQVRRLRGDFIIDEELEVFTIKKRTHQLPFTNRRLLIRSQEGYRQDDFRHEQFLVIRQDGRTVLMSGCAHNGILSILDAFAEKYGRSPDLVVSGFHLMKKTPYSEDELREIDEIAGELTKYPTKFVTCHCTGETAYDRMKAMMGGQLAYVHSGEEISKTDGLTWQVVM